MGGKTKPASDAYVATSGIVYVYFPISDRATRLREDLPFYY